MARGGLRNMKVNFKGCSETLEDVFGKTGIPVTQMTKKIWQVIKKKKLMKS